MTPTYGRVALTAYPIKKASLPDDTVHRAASGRNDISFSGQSAIDNGDDFEAAGVVSLRQGFPKSENTGLDR